MPAVSRERVCLQLNFIVQLASHIWVPGSLEAGGGGRLLPRGGAGSRPQETRAGAGGGPFRLPGWGGRGRGRGGGPSVAGVFFSYLKEIKAARPAHTGFLFSPSSVPSPPVPRRAAASPFTGARRRSQSEAIRIENLCKTAVN